MKRGHNNKQEENYMTFVTVVREIFAYKNFHVLNFRVKNFSDIAKCLDVRKILTQKF